METTAEKTLSLLDKLGFKEAVENVRKKKELARKLSIAMEHYRYVTHEKLEDFDKRLRRYTHNFDRQGGYQYLSLVKVEDYEQVPPASVLRSMEEAVERKCFDNFEIASIKEVNDPILFGKVNGCTHLFFIDQWDDDIKISDLIKENEG
jgi:hypothetical protein